MSKLISSCSKSKQFYENISANTFSSGGHWPLDTLTGNYVSYPGTPSVKMSLMDEIRVRCLGSNWQSVC